MPMVPTPWKLRPSKPPGKTSLTPRGRNAASAAAAIDERQYRDRNHQQSDKTQHDGAELVRRGPQRYRVGGVGPNAFHDMSPGPAAMARALGVSRRGNAASSKSSAVVPRESRASSTPGALGSSLAASGILDRPLSRVMTLFMGRVRTVAHPRIQTAAPLSERGGW